MCNFKFLTKEVQYSKVRNFCFAIFGLEGEMKKNIF